MKRSARTTAKSSDLQSQIVVGVIVFVSLAIAWWKTVPSRQDINSFEACAAAGYPILESYPAQCRTPDGNAFTQEIASPEAVFLP